MAKPEIIKSNRKRTFRFSNFEELEKGLKIAIGQKWSTFIITGVAEDKKELVEDWINNNRGKYKGINIRIGRTYTRQFVLIYSGIEELKKGLSSAIKRKFRKIIVEDVSKEERKTANDWIKKNQGEYKDINIKVRVPYKGLHPNEKEKIRNKVGAHVSFFDDAILNLEENGEKLFFDNWINSESPQKRIDRIKIEIKHQQKTYKIKGIEKIEKKKIKLELKYLKQLLDQNKIEIEIFNELKKQTEKDILGNAHRRRKRWTDKKRLRLIVRKIDKTLLKKLRKKPSREDVEIEFQENYMSYDTDKLIKPFNLEEVYFEYGRDGFIDFGKQFYKTVSEARKAFP
jgi:putative lipoic acid-binding regulatory protein